MGLRNDKVYKNQFFSSLNCFHLPGNDHFGVLLFLGHSR